MSEAVMTEVTVYDVYFNYRPHSTDYFPVLKKVVVSEKDFHKIIKRGFWIDLEDRLTTYGLGEWIPAWQIERAKPRLVKKHAYV